MDQFLLYIILLLVLLLFSAFFSGSEAALFSLRRTQLKSLEAASPAGKRISRLRSSSRKLLVSILIGNLLVNIFTTSAVTSISIRMFGERGVGLSFALMSILILAIGEVIPKAIALNRPRRFSLAIVYPLSFFHALFLPLRAPLFLLAESVINLLKRQLGTARLDFTHEELITAVRIGRFEGELGRYEHEVLSNILSFRNKIVREIMTPSVSVFSLPASMSIEDLFDAVIRRGHSRVPIYGESSDEIIGILHIKDLLRGATPGAGTDVTGLIKPVHHVPETAPVAELFEELATRKTHLAVVIDEYGSFVGIATLEDILEEIVGEIRDAGEPRTEEYKKIGEDKIIVLGTMEIDRFNEVFDVTIEDKEHETVAGYLLGATGRIPHEGETISIGDLRFHVISARPNAVKKLRVEKV